MSAANEPQTDREWMVQLAGEIKSLRESVDTLNKNIVEMEVNKISSLEARIDELESFKQQIAGGWKLAAVIWVILTSGIVWLLKKIIQ